jgi:hypothetical protein
MPEDGLENGPKYVVWLRLEKRVKDDKTGVAYGGVQRTFVIHAQQDAEP